MLAGTSTLNVALSLTEGAIAIDTARLENPQLSLSATGSVTEALRRIDLSARLANLALLAPDFPGPVTVEGTATEAGEGLVDQFAARYARDYRALEAPAYQLQGQVRQALKARAVARQ